MDPKEAKYRPPDDMVHFANAPYATTPGELDNLFSHKIGEITNMELYSNEHGQFNGTGVVEFKEGLAKKAVKILNGLIFNGRTLNVKLLSQHSLDLYERGVPIPSPYGVKGRESERLMPPWDGFNKPVHTEEDRYKRSKREHNPPERHPAERRRSEPYDTSRNGRGRRDEGGQSHGERGHQDFVRRDRQRKSRWEENDRFDHGINILSSLDSAFLETYGIRPSILERLGIRRPLTRGVVVTNLGYRITEEKVFKVFKMAGRIKSIRCHSSSDYNTYATVEFYHPVAAVQAISMFNGKHLFEQEIEVIMDDLAEGEPALSLAQLGLEVDPILAHQGEASDFEGKYLESRENQRGLERSGRRISLLGPHPDSFNLGSSSVRRRYPSNHPPPLMETVTRSPLLSSGSISLSLGKTASGPEPLIFSTGNPGRSLMQSASSLLDNSMRSSLETIGAGDSYPVTSLGLITGPFGTGTRGGNKGDYGDYDARAAPRQTSSFSSDTICLRKLPPNVNFAVLVNKLREIGDVVATEPRGANTALVKFATMRDAQRATNLMDGARVDGQIIEVFTI